MVDKKFTIKATKRDVFGRKVKKARAKGNIPANVFGKGFVSSSIVVAEKDFLQVYKEAGETKLIDIDLGGKSLSVLVNDIQKDPRTEAILHVSFHKVDLKVKVSANVPVIVVGVVPAEKQGLGTLVTLLDEIEIEALPTDIPEKFEVDATGLTEAESFIAIKDLKYDKKKVEVKANPEEVVVRIAPIEKEEVIAPAPEVPTEGVPAEAPAEGGEGEQKQEQETKTEEAPKE